MKKKSFMVLLAVFLFTRSNLMWSTEFQLTQDTSSGGIIAVNPNTQHAVLMSRTRDAVKFKDIYNDQGEVVGSDFKEPWMRNSGERNNHHYVEVQTGGKEQLAKLVLKDKAQYARWWHSQDVKTIYINTLWIDYTTVDTFSKYDKLHKAYFYKIFKSTDGGQSFKALESWPRFRQVVQILFDETGQYGYAIGEQKSLWRTSDGGETWVSIQVPLAVMKELDKLEYDFRIDASFNAYHFDEKTKNFYFSNLFSNGTQYYSAVYKLAWSDDPKQNRVEEAPLLTLPNSDISDINSDGDNLYMFGFVYDFVNKLYRKLDTEVSFLQASPDEHNQYQWIKRVKIGNGLILGKLYIGKDHLLYSAGAEMFKEYPFDKEISVSSRDRGETWQINRERSSFKSRMLDPINAEMFDPTTNTLYVLKEGVVKSQDVATPNLNTK